MTGNSAKVGKKAQSRGSQGKVG